MLRDGLIEEQLIVGVMIADESRGTTLEGKIKDYVSGVPSPLTPYKRYCGVSENRLFFSKEKSEIYRCFN
jgi:hypothetical protein